jgi:hypothetical protein
MGLGWHPAPGVSVWKRSYPKRALCSWRLTQPSRSRTDLKAQASMLSVDDGSVVAPTASEAVDLVDLVRSKHVQDAQTLEASGLLGN